MVLPIYKVLSLVIRVASRPLINYTKQIHLKGNGIQHPHLRKGFIYLGNSYHRMESYINRRFMKIQSQFAYKPLNDQLAIEKGIQFFYQIFFYSLVIGLPLYEMIRGAAEGKQKSKVLQDRLKKIEQKLDESIQCNKKHQEQKNQKDIKQIPIPGTHFLSKPITLTLVDGSTKKYLV